MSGGPGHRPRFLTLWAVNAAIDLAESRRQLERFRAAGLDGVVLHPRNYRASPAYLSERYLDTVSAVVLQAAALGLAVWIYDENGWPSGTVGGELLARYPEHAQQWLQPVPEAPPGIDVLARFDGVDGPLAIVAERGTGVDYLARGTAERFIELTHERYRLGMSPEAFAHVEGFFDDEPEFGLGHAFSAIGPHGAVPWTPSLPQAFEERFGRPLLPLLPAVFTSMRESAWVRVRFWELVSDLFSANFLDPIQAWCDEHGKRFTAHLKGEETPHFQVALNGGVLQALRHIGLPGVDALGRDPSNDFFPIEVVSVGRQSGSGRSMAEAFGGAGWGAGPADLERYLLWLGRHGVTDFVLHLSQYRLDSEAIVDWPPSQPLHVTWSAVYSEVLDRVRRSLDSHPPAAPDLVLIAPQRRVTALFEPWELVRTNIHDGSDHPSTPAAAVSDRLLSWIADLLAAGVRFDIVDERAFEREAVVDGGLLRIGAARYRGVLMSDDVLLDAAARAAADRFCVPPMLGTTPDVLDGAAPVSVGDARPLTWTVAADQPNDLLLEAHLAGDDWIIRITLDEPIGAPLEVRFADEVSICSLDGEALDIAVTTAGSVARLPPFPSSHEFVIRFRTAEPAGVRPRAWMHGAFRVHSVTPWSRSADGTERSTEGPFVLRSACSGPVSELVEDGFPFLGSEMAAQCDQELGRMDEALLLGARVDAIRVVGPKGASPWAWPDDDGALRIDGLRDGGPFRIEVVPNGFNHYGPHHYYRGDPHLVSPAQMAGVRNFADEPDAPTITHGLMWRFQTSALPEAVAAVPRQHT